jgi:hypothetical protein
MTSDGTASGRRDSRSPVCDGPGCDVPGCDVPECVGECVVDDADLFPIPPAEPLTLRAASLRALTGLESAPDASLGAVLTAVDVSGLDSAGRVAYARAWERYRRWVELQAVQAVAAAVGPDDADQWPRMELAAEFMVSEARIRNQVELARSLATRLVNTRAAVAAATVDLFRAQILAWETRHLSDEQVRDLEPLLLPYASTESPARFTRRVRAAVIATDPQAAEARRAAARSDRHVRGLDAGDGMLDIWARLEHHDGLALLGVLGANAGRTGPDDERTHDQRMADALVALTERELDRLTPDPERVGGGSDDPDVARARRRHARRSRRTAHVVIDLPTLLGLAENPGEVPGVGPVPPSLARELAGDAQWRRLVCDPMTGELLDLSPETYTPGVALSRYLRARHTDCVHPHCSRSSEDSELDHVVAFSAGGLTTRANLVPRSARCHHAKHDGAWVDVPDPHRPGWGTLRSPSGVEQRYRPTDYRPPLDPGRSQPAAGGP